MSQLAGQLGQLTIHLGRRGAAALQPTMSPTPQDCHDEGSANEGKEDSANELTHARVTP
jgi:hypothetical protein